MALNLITNLEKTVWKEWSNRLPSFEKYFVRKQYYPNDMDQLNKIFNTFVNKRRESTKRYIAMRNDLPSEFSEEERNQWREDTIAILVHDTDLEKMLIDKKATEFLKKMDMLEQKRLSNILNIHNNKDDDEDAKIREAAECLIYFANKANQECMKAKQKKLRFEQETPPLRRSKRLQEKKKKH